MNEAKHCVICGDTHSGECSEGSFVKFKCKNCGLDQKLPWDVLAFCGLEGMYCGCGEPAMEVWEQVNNKPKEISKEDREALDKIISEFNKT